MARPSVAAAIRAAPLPVRASAIAVLVVLSGGLALAFAVEQSGLMPLAWWWPAAGVGAVATAATCRRWRPVTALAIGALWAGAAALAGRPLAVVLLGAVGAVIEVWAVGAAVNGRDDRPRLQSLADVGRFAIGAVGGAAIAAALLGLGSELSGGAFLDLFWPVIASHLSALALLAPLGLISIPLALTRPLWRSPVLTVTMLAVTVVAFWPGMPTAMVILPLPLMAWAAVAEPMFVVAVQVLAVVILSGGMSLVGGGGFVATAGTLSPATALQTYTIALVATTLAISATQNDRRAIESKESAISHLLHDAFRQSKSGFVILQDDGQDSFSVLEVNAAAVVMLRGEFERSESGRWMLREGALLRPYLAQATLDVSVTVDWEDVAADNLPATITIDAVNRTGLNRVLLISVQDLRPLRDAEREMEWRLERERQVSRTFQALNQQKVDFVASVTHELRTPITSILGFAEELSDATTDPQLRDYVDVIMRNATRLRGVIDDVLLVSKMSRAPRNADETEITDAGAALQRSIEDATHSIRQHELDVHAEIPEGLVVWGRDNDVARVFTNILTNAIKFSPPGGEIVVSAWRSDHQVTVTITDQGEGISDEDLSHIFDRFYRSAETTRRGVPGTGLGLSIVKELLSAMGGRIELRRAEPLGTIAQITLAAADPAAHPSPALPAR